MNSPMTELDHHFYVCGVCDTDKNIKKGLIALEDVREFEAQRRGVTDHVRKLVLDDMCIPHREEIVEAVYNYAPKK